MNLRASPCLLPATLALALAAVRLLHSTPQIASASGEVQVIGPLAMLQLQREHEPILDARVTGRAIPGATRHFPQGISAPPLIVARDGAEAQRQARAHGWSGLVRWVPARLLEVRTRRDVAQVSAREVMRRVARGEVEVIDVSEAGEWDALHLPGSRRVEWRRIIAGDRSWVPRNRGIVFT